MLRLIRSPAPAMPDLRLVCGHTYIRPPHDRDWSAWAELRNGSRAFLMPWEPTWPADALSRDYFRRRLRQQTQDWRDDLAYSFFLFRVEDDAIIGGINVSNVRRGVAQTASLGYWVGAAQARNGHMSRALAAVIHYSFDRLALHRLEAACLPDNEASAGLLLKCGFREEGFARRYLRINGAWADHRLFALLADDPRPPGKVIMA
ncbi:MAG: GNAT family protein [Alphaproteobacteria bacterium]